LPCGSYICLTDQDPFESKWLRIPKYHRSHASKHSTSKPASPKPSAVAKPGSPKPKVTPKPKPSISLVKNQQQNPPRAEDNDAVASPPSTMETASLLSPSGGDGHGVDIGMDDLLSAEPLNSTWGSQQPAASWFAVSNPLVSTPVLPTVYQIGSNTVLEKAGWEYIEAHKSIRDVCLAAQKAQFVDILVLSGRMAPIQNTTIQSQEELLTELTKNVSKVRSDWGALILHAPDPTLHKELIAMPVDFAGKYEPEFYPKPPGAFWLTSTGIRIGSELPESANCLDLFEKLQQASQDDQSNEKTAVYMLHPCFEEKAKKSKKKKEETKDESLPSMGNGDDVLLDV